MEILLVSPTEFEMEASSLLGFEKYVVGVGPVCAAIKMTQVLERKSPRLVILFGVCGSYPDSGLSIGDVVIAKKEVFADIARCFKDREEDISILSAQDLSFDLRAQLGSLLGERLSDFLTVNFVTVCCSTMYKRRAERLASRWNAKVENMEGASIAKVCKMYNVSFLEIRSVSNIVCDPIELWEFERAINALKKQLTDIVNIIKRSL